MMLVALLVACCVYLAFMAAKVALALSYAVNEEVSERPLPDGSAAVLQPILSGDPGLADKLEENLTSLPGQHFVWLCDEDDPEAIRITDERIAAHPGIRITRLLCPPCPPETNPKVFKLILAADVVCEPFVIVVDDDTHLSAGTAATLVFHASRSEIATGLPCYTDGGDFPSSLLAQFVNNNSAMTYLSLLPFMRPLSINGMCYAMKRGEMDAFPEIRHHLTDDLALALKMLGRGGTIHQSARPQRISTSVDGIGHYVRLMHRWHLFAWLLVREQPPILRVLIFLMHGWHPLLLWTILILTVSGISWSAGAVLVVFLACRASLLVMMQRRLFGENLHRPVVSVLAELLQPFHLAHALVDRHINWRGRKYHVFASDRFERHG